jgi:uncharacterized protein (TIGR00369 family)
MTQHELTIAYVDPRPGLADAVQRSGLDMLQAMLAGQIAPPPIAKLMDIALTEVSAGRSVFVGNPGIQHMNPIGSVHGGFAATLLDAALGVSIHSLLPAGTTYTTVELSINYIRAIQPETGALTAIGSAIHVGRRLATAEARLENADGKLFAHGTTTCMVMPLQGK